MPELRPNGRAREGEVYVCVFVCACTVVCVHPRGLLIRKICKTCSDIWVFLDDTNVQRNVGLASLGHAPQQRKMQNAKGMKQKIDTPCCQILRKPLALYVLPVTNVSQIRDWIRDWNCEVMTGGLIQVHGGWTADPKFKFF